MADFLIKAGADIELGCSTPLMEAAQEGHLELVKYLLAAGMELFPLHTFVHIYNCKPILKAVLSQGCISLLRGFSSPCKYM